MNVLDALLSRAKVPFPMGLGETPPASSMLAHVVGPGAAVGVELLWAFAVLEEAYVCVEVA